MADDRMESDDSVALFLELLAKDIANFPEKITALEPDCAQRIHRLVEGVVSDPEEPLGEEDFLSGEIYD